MFSEREYLYQAERRQDDIRYAERQRLLQKLPTSMKVTTHMSQIVFAHFGKRLIEWGRQLKAESTRPTPPHGAHSS